jgi:hypothetical protein
LVNFGRNKATSTVRGTNNELVEALQRATTQLYVRYRPARTASHESAANCRTCFDSRDPMTQLTVQHREALNSSQIH